MNICKKCKSTDIATSHIEIGKLIDSSSTKKIDNEFITPSEYDFYYKLVAKKEHLHKRCRNCQYDWRENTADSDL
jgi:hypothetical protein